MGDTDSFSSMVSERRVELLSAEHAEGLRVLSTDFAFAAAAGVSVGLSAEGAADYIAVAEKAREEGWSYVFVLIDGTEVLGVCRLIGVRGVPRIIVAIGLPYRGQGNGTLLVKQVLEFAFAKLGEEQVTASGPCLRLLAQFGPLSGQALTRKDWQDNLDRNR
jgi:RimJ/RimL family protein N-acetyltransferase